MFRGEPGWARTLHAHHEWGGRQSGRSCVPEAARALSLRRPWAPVSQMEKLKFSEITAKTKEAPEGELCASPPGLGLVTAACQPAWRGGRVGALFPRKPDPSLKPLSHGIPGPRLWPGGPGPGGPWPTLFRLPPSLCWALLRGLSPHPGRSRSCRYPGLPL